MTMQNKYTYERSKDDDYIEDDETGLMKAVPHIGIFAPNGDRETTVRSTEEAEAIVNRLNEKLDAEQGEASIIKRARAVALGEVAAIKPLAAKVMATGDVHVPVFVILDSHGNRAPVGIPIGADSDRIGKAFDALVGMKLTEWHSAESTIICVSLIHEAYAANFPPDDERTDEQRELFRQVTHCEIAVRDLPEELRRDTLAINSRVMMGGQVFSFFTMFPIEGAIGTPRTLSDEFTAMHAQYLHEGNSAGTLSRPGETPESATEFANRVIQ